MARWMKKAVSVIVIVAVAAVAVVIAAALGTRQDPRFERMVNSPGVIEKGLRPGSPGKAGPAAESDVPLVKAAREFAAYLTPPPPQPISSPVPQKTPEIIAAVPDVRPAVVSAKFELRGVSYNRSTPTESIVLISQPGGNTIWVRQGAQVGHLIVEKINNDSIVCRDGQNTQELALKIDDGAIRADGGAKVAASPAGKLPSVDVGKPQRTMITAVQPPAARPPAQVLTARMLVAERRRHAQTPYKEVAVEQGTQR